MTTIAVPASTADVPEPAARVVDSAFRELLSGTNKGAMNLAAVEARALDLRRCLDEMLTGLTRNAHNISWPDTLDRFAVLNVQFQHLHSQLRPIAKHYIAHPRAVEQDPSASQILPIMLATKLLPDLESSRAAHLEAHFRQAGTASASVHYDSLLEATEKFNAGIDRLCKPHSSSKSGADSDSAGLLHHSAAIRRAIAAIGRPTGAKAGHSTQLRRPQAMLKRKKPAQSSALLLAALEGVGLETA